MLMNMYSPFATSSDKSTSYSVSVIAVSELSVRLISFQTFAEGQLSYALGKNPMSCPYVVGMNPNSPQNPHSALASGGDDVSQIDTVPAQETYVLYGAVIGGPDRTDRMFDIRSDWPEMEVSCCAFLDMNSFSSVSLVT